MAERMTSRYGSTFHPILNAFDPGSRTKSSGTGVERPTKYTWHSQTIGPDRGLEQFIRIMPYIPNCELHLRGMIAPDFKETLFSCALESGVSMDQIHFSSLLPAHRLIDALPEYDVGLAIEVVTSGNREACLSNKIFEYLAAGLPMILSNTPAQRAMARELGDAALLIDLFRPDISGPAIREWIGAHDTLARAAAEAQKLAHDRFNWQHESVGLVSLISSHAQRSPCAS